MAHDPTHAPEAARPPVDMNPRSDPPLDFPDADFGQLRPGDYDALGFMCGLEVHQQLATTSKLFCRCPAGVRTTRVDAEILRHMRPTLSELGEYDGTALMEFKTRKEIVYLLERGSVCTYELDDTPPFEIDPEAVRISLAVSRLLGLNLVGELHVMRKQYLDGSIPTGFQRTAMVGLSGEVPFEESELGPGRVIGIRQLSLEEDSCREVSDVGHRITFRTDRLGMPLTETVTEPDLLTPIDAMRGGLLMARVARATGRVQRGPGTARQDVNVSVAGGRRVEIKGVSSHRLIPRLVHNEAFRQLNLLRIRAELLHRGVTDSMLQLPEEGSPWETSDLAVDARSILKKCNFAPVTDALTAGDMVAAVRLPGFGGLLGHGVQPGMSFATEIQGRAQVIACLTGRPCMLHSALEYGLKGSEWAQLRSALGAGSRSTDAIVLVWGDEQDAATACREVAARAREALVGVPSETRQAFVDGTTGFERILPGPDRMYPDTDTPPVPVPDGWVTEIDANLPEAPWKRAAHYGELGLDRQAAWRLTDAPWSALFDALEPATPEAARRLGAALEKRLVQLGYGGHGADLPDAERLAPLVRALEAGGPFRHAFETALLRTLGEPGQDPDDVLDALRTPKDAERALEQLIEGAKTTRGELMTRDPAATMRWAMGLVMRPLLGRLEPLDVQRRLAGALGIGEVTP